MMSGFSFGKNTTASTFGTSTLTFGTPTTQTMPTFGTPTTQNQSTFGTGLGVSTGPTTTGDFQFGAATATTSAPTLFGTQSGMLNFKPGGLGTTTTTQSTGLFGAPASASTSTAPTGLGFGVGVPTTSTTGLTFGAQPASGGLTLGGSTTTTLPGTGFTHGSTPATASTGLSFGANTTPSLFGTTFPATSSIAPQGLSFGSTSSNVAPTLGTTTTAASGITFGLGSTQPTTSASTTGLFGLGGTSTTALGATTTTPSVGLGGVETAQTKIVTTQKEVPPKEQPLPNEILQTVEQFKEMVKLQKMYSSDIARCSVREFRKVEQEIDHLMSLLSDVESQLQKNRNLAEKLKYDTAKCLQNVEMAQRTQDTPPGLQYENTAPLKFFMDLADQFEREMQVLKYQIESADNYVKNHRTPDTLTPQDLALGMRRLHETFVALAGRLQSVHSQVESQKEHYLALRRQLLNDTSNPFEKINPQANVIVKSPTYCIPKVATGPTPFSSLTMDTGSSIVMQQNQSAATTGFGSGGQTGFGSSFFESQSSVQPLGGSFASTPTMQSPFGTSSFQLQKPPTGSKRGRP